MNHGGWGTTRIKGVAHCHPEAQHYAKGLCRVCYRNTPYFKRLRQEYYRSHREQWVRQGKRTVELRLKQVKAYGISSEEQSLMIEAQGHVCALCGHPPGRKGLAIDHDHGTGQVRGMLCGRCNTALGLLKDDPGLCERAAEYLRHHTLPTATAAA